MKTKTEPRTYRHHKVLGGPTTQRNTMKAKSIVLLASALGAIAGTLHAAPRSSANYSVITDVVDGGGKRTASAAYTNDGSIGGIAGISTLIAPAETVKHGYLGQLYDLASGISLSATPATINEGGTRQLSAVRNLDDGTGLALDPAAVAWSVLGGPITGINLTGVATAGTVYQNTGASVQGVASGFTASLTLTVLNVNNDDLPGYSGDGIDDAWQVQYFGLPPNANAGPLMDPDGDGQTNAFECTAGLVPTDPASRFVLSIAPVPGQPAQKKLIFSPRFPSRSYAVKFKTDLAGGTWSLLPSSTFTDNGQERTVTDLSATGAKKFYQVEITKP